MILHSLFTSLLVLFPLCRTVKATALTTAITANERLCFYADVDKAGEKIGVRTHVTGITGCPALIVTFWQFYFAVRPLLFI